MYGRVITAGAGIVVVELVVVAVGAGVVEGCTATEVSGRVLGVASWTSEQAATAIARAVNAATDR
jgi:hypothetical protein